MKGVEINRETAGREAYVCMRNAADLRKDIRFVLEWHLTLYCRKASTMIITNDEWMNGCMYVRMNE